MFNMLLLGFRLNFSHLPLNLCPRVPDFPMLRKRLLMSLLFFLLKENFFFLPICIMLNWNGRTWEFEAQRLSDGGNHDARIGKRSRISQRVGSPSDAPGTMGRINKREGMIGIKNMDIKAKWCRYSKHKMETENAGHFHHLQIKHRLCFVLMTFHRNVK